MLSIELVSAINIQLHNIARHCATEEAHYHNVISPFSRLYLIEQGSGKIMMNNKTLILKPGYLYLIPSFTRCSYSFDADLIQYYIHLSTQMTNGTNIFDVFSNKYIIEATSEDKLLIDKLLNLHPNMNLPSSNPSIYQTRKWMSKKVSYLNISQYLETRGILNLLLARFLYEDSHTTRASRVMQSNLKSILTYIHQNLPNKIAIPVLAEMACLSKDHFTRVFKSVTGYPPVEYIARKRIEQAQFLLLTTNKPQQEIIEAAGFSSAPYFSKMFIKYTGTTPGKYRKQNTSL